tara:strand:- start:2886 stop:3206 length:321 start_codon:yes stop_codon:yes gene_type:complete
MKIKQNYFLVVFLLLNSFYSDVSTETNLTNTFLKDVKNCFSTEEFLKCKGIISQAEKMQLYEYSKGNLKCQTSLLGMQTELIRNIYFQKDKKKLSSKIINNVIKNC